MNIGMLWFDNDPKTDLDNKIKRAATYYHTKYGCAPNLCFVHPSMLPKDQTLSQTKPDEPQASSKKSGVIELRATRSVMPNHFWIGTSA